MGFRDLFPEPLVRLDEVDWVFSRAQRVPSARSLTFGSDSSVRGYGMRAFRALAVAAALIAVHASDAGAQVARGFKDSWFWGVRGGGLLYSSYSNTNEPIAPMAGADWLITRTHGGLYVGFDYSFFNTSVVVNDSVHPDDACSPPTAVRTACRDVNMNNMRRFTMAGVLFPLQSKFIQPYIGFGVALNHIGDAEPDTLAYVADFGVPYRNRLQFELVNATIQTFRTSTTPLFMLGTQMRLPMVSVFTQFTASPAHTNFLLSNGRPYRLTLEMGARYNAGSSIDRMR